MQDIYIFLDSRNSFSHTQIHYETGIKNYHNETLIKKLPIALQNTKMQDPFTLAYKSKLKLK